MGKTHIRMTINGRAVDGLAEPRTLLVHFLRENLNLRGAHIGCETSHCGACTVLAVQAEGAEITTVEGLVNPDGSLGVIQEMFREHHGLQCGYCTPGMIVRAHRLLQENPQPTEAEVRFGIAGNLCRCTGY